MVVQKTINNLKQGSKDEKTAVATGGAVIVVAILLIGYGLWFVSNLKRGGQFNTTIETRKFDSFVAPAVRDAERVLQDTVRPNSDELRSYRENQGVAPLEPSSGEGNDNPFNVPEQL